MTDNNNQTKISIDIFFQMLGMDDPIPAVHVLRESDPVHFVQPPGFWLLTRHDDIRSMFNNSGQVTQNKRAWEFYVTPPEGSMRRWSEEYGIFAVDGAEHSRLRRLVSAAFTPRSIRRIEAQIREVIDRVAAPLRGRQGDVIDIVSTFSNVIPNAVVSRITGVSPGADEERFCMIAQAVILGGLPFTSEDVQRQAEQGFKEFASIIRELVTRRRAAPEEDLVSDLLRAESEDDTCTEDDIVLLLASIIGAGSEATAQVALAIVRTLLCHPQTMNKLRSDRSLIRKTLDELLRFSFSLPAGTMRFAVKDFELRGKMIRKGQMLMLSGAGANRDPAVYNNPDSLDLHRTVHQSLTFGYGPHHCLGANLAREEIVTMVDVMLDILPEGSKICTEQLEYRDMGMFRQAINLPVRVGG